MAAGQIGQLRQSITEKQEEANVKSSQRNLWMSTNDRAPKVRKASIYAIGDTPISEIPK